MSATHAEQLRALYARWDDAALTASSVATAKMGILDVAGCIVGGSPTATATIARELAPPTAGRDGASVLGTSLRTAAPATCWTTTT